MIFVKCQTYFKQKNFANRGMTLESDINITNEYYIENNIALIYKKPTPIKVAKIDYSHNKITDAYFECPSTLDYNGIYQGKYIEFDAKETNSKTSFPIANIHKHQIEHIKRVIDQRGIVFLLVRFNLLNENYILMGQDLITFLNTNKRKSIPHEYFNQKGYPVQLKYTPRLDYLKEINKIMEVL